MLSTVFGIVAVMASGIVAGVLFAVAISTVPALLAMPPGQYIYAHKLLGRNWDPTMPVIVLTATALDVVLAILAPNGLGALLFGVGAALLVMVAVVSHWCNVPINRQLRTLDPDRMPAEWQDPRPLWRRWHLLRSTLAALALALNASAVALS
ncbi:Uncharacterized membrane protein [Amycolatopsis arida]|uniref:Uncharacterized membrane protein n=1 Tax=Amycolatopsis arida TaxID=587909 RepID=A0A1I6A7L5_9PSEU|nr:DUF1772 domain-containing protein [Amycolatopsis arida]TDX88541.1 putative membrane protein [Amycolatopsis arida]SFQ64726.1 Uncharacterized membrane protein [Amycolatopsis arida]